MEIPYTTPSTIPTTASVGELKGSISSFLQQYPDLHLGGRFDNLFHERALHAKVFSISHLTIEQTHPICEVEHTAISGPHGTIPIRILYPFSGEDRRNNNTAAALIYMHGGGWSVGSVDEWENGLRYLAEHAGVQIYAVEYRLSPEFQHPMQLDEYDAVIDAVQGDFGSSRGANRVLGGGDSVGGNMTAAISLRRQDQGKKALEGQVLLYPLPRLPFDTLAAQECATGYYLQANGLMGFMERHLPRKISPTERYVSPGLQPVSQLQGLPRAAVYTAGFDPLRDVGVEFASKLQLAGNEVVWRHYDGLVHSFLQMTAWSEAARSAVKEVAADVREMAYDEK